MIRRARLGAALLVATALAQPARAEEEYEVHWSATLEAALRHIASQEADDDVTGFFDRYEYVPNKSSSLPVELGVRDAAVDLFAEGETPRLQFRLESPTSNLGVSGRDIERPFLNQRADLFGRLEGLDLDLAFRRLRTDRLRRFPNPGTGPPFLDRTAPDDRFFRERTGFEGELRLRPQDLFEAPDFVSWLGPQLALRGGTQVREGQRQVRAILPASRWLGLTRDVDQNVDDLGGGVLVAPGGFFTLVFDIDHERFREGAPAPLDSDVGVPFTPSAQTIGFVPETDRTTGSLRFQTRLGELLALEAGFQLARLEQVGNLTPRQRSNGLSDNEVRYTSANFALDLAIAGPVSANAFLKFDRRDNDLDRGTMLFSSGNGSQVGPFVDRWKRFFAGAEVVYRLRAANQLALGLRTEQISRDLDFAPFIGAPQRILPQNAQIADKSESYTVYGRAALRPLAALGMRGELGYRKAPETGYILDLDDYVYGKLRASYTVSLERPVVLTLFARGGSGKNNDFSHLAGQGPIPAGPPVGRDFERWDYRWGLSAATSPWDDVSLFASFFHSRNAQDEDLVLSSAQRFLQDSIALAFTRQGPLEYRADDLVGLVGTRVQFDERTDAGLSYAFTRALARYGASGALNGPALRDARRVDGDIHRVSVEAGRLLRDGLRLVVGYRFDYFDDRSPVVGVGSTPPFDLRTFQHTVTLGVTLTDALLD